MNVSCHRVTGPLADPTELPPQRPHLNAPQRRRRSEVDVTQKHPSPYVAVPR